MNEPTHNRDAANLGVLRPPLIYLASILLACLLDLGFPMSLPRPSFAAPLGMGVVLAAIALFTASVRTFRAAGTPVPGNRPTTTIVQDGPYGFSRNPIYLAFSLFVLGIALWTGMAWLVLTLAVAVALMHFVVIPREERYLATRFPGDYPPYKASVRRWL